MLFVRTKQSIELEKPHVCITPTFCAKMLIPSNKRQHRPIVDLGTRFETPKENAFELFDPSYKPVTVIQTPDQSMTPAVGPVVLSSS
jgi:hypothetical protein